MSTVTNEIVALSHLQRRFNITNPIHGVVLAAAPTSGNAQALIANSSGNQVIAAGNLTLTAGNMTLTAGTFTGNGSGLGSLNASNLSTGTVPLGRISGLTNTEISASAAIAYSKLNLTGLVVNADIAAAAAIAYTKLALTNTIVNADIAAAAAIAYSKLNLTGLVVNADIAAGAAIVDTKLATISTALKVSNSATTANASNVNSAIVARDGTGSFSASNISCTMVTISGTTTNAADVATKAYVDSVMAGLDPKASVRVATTANITLSAPQTIDGVAVIAGDRVLVKNQTTGSANGIYVVAAGAWTRSADADISAEVTPGMFTFIEEGTTLANTGWVLATTGITLGTTSLVFSQFTGAGSFNAGAGMTQTGNTINVIAADTTITVNADSIQVGANSLLNSHVNASAGIAYSKLNLGSSIVNSDIFSGAAIAYTKLALTNTIVNADIAAAAAIAYSKLNLTGTIVNADIGAAAAIVDTKLATISTAGKVADTALSNNVVLENGSNVFTNTNEFQGLVKIGNGNQDVLETQSLEIEVDTRNFAVTYNGDGTLNVITEKDSATTVKTTTYAYDGNGNVSTRTIVAGGKTITETFVYTGNDITSVTKTVV